MKQEKIEIRYLVTQEQMEDIRNQFKITEKIK